ncbi:unnamed protein product [Ceutorhynchus assimilis]|uniref:Scavenger receptor class B member 1 n=1 Tax=Ceutorhynchus assimilis TaxID=467358 RepID=A0A9P0DNE4_9CUCU|nr:unnamed protein product [Ceutorhynchus assimilis]
MLRPGTLYKLPLAIFFLALGISSIIYTPTDFLFDMRLRMIRGTPPYTFWADPPDNLLAKVYIFNVTNSQQFLDGTEDFIHLQEIGPIIYREKFTHTNIVFNNNSTLTYTVTRTLEYLPERNTIDLNSTITAPNLAVLVMTSYFSDSSFFVKAGLNILLNKYNCEPFKNMTIYEYLMNATDPVLEPAKSLAPALVPSLNVGILKQMYMKNSYNITVLIGPKYGHEDYFNVQNIDGVESLPSFKRCKPQFNRTSETTLFPQFMRKDQNINAWKAVLCMAVNGYFTNETRKYGMTGYRYDVTLDAFNRTQPEYSDCYRGNPALPNGLSDVSTCYSNYPFAASFPHLMNADPVVSNRIRGMKPDIAKHGSFLNVEPMSGVPMSGRAIFQVNLIFKRMTGFGRKIQRFSNMYLPMSYVGYEIEGLPWHIVSLLYFMTVIVPKTQLIMSLILLAVGTIYLYYFSRDFRTPRVLKESCISTICEEEKFIKIENQT